MSALIRLPISRRSHWILIALVIMAIIGTGWYALSANASEQPSDDTKPKLLTEYSAEEDTVTSVRYKAWLWSVCVCYDSTEGVEAFDACTGRYTYSLASRIGYEPSNDQAMLDIQGCRK